MNSEVKVKPSIPTLFYDSSGSKEDQMMLRRLMLSLPVYLLEKTLHFLTGPLLLAWMHY